MFGEAAQASWSVDAPAIWAPRRPWILRDPHGNLSRARCCSAPRTRAHAMQDGPVERDGDSRVLQGALEARRASGTRALQRGDPGDARSKSTMRLRRTGASGERKAARRANHQEKQSPTKARQTRDAEQFDYCRGGDDRGRPARRGAREPAAQLGCGAGLGFADSHADDAATDPEAHAAPDAQADAANQGSHAQAERQADDVAADQANHVSVDCSPYDSPAHDTDAAADGPARRASATAAPTTAAPTTTASPTTASPTTASPTTAAPTTQAPTKNPTMKTDKSSFHFEGATLTSCSVNAKYIRSSVAYSGVTCDGDSLTVWADHELSQGVANSFKSGLSNSNQMVMDDRTSSPGSPGLYFFVDVTLKMVVRRQTDGSRITRHSVHGHPARPSCRRPVLVSRRSRARAERGGWDGAFGCTAHRAESTGV